MDVIRTEDLTRIYEGSTAAVINSVNLTVAKGDFLVIMGSSGSGKSTLLYLLSGLDTPTRGRVLVSGRDITAMNETGRAKFRRRGMGFVFQDFNLVNHLSVLQNITVPGSLTEKNGSRLEAKALTLLEKLGIKALADRKPSRISGGEAQRCSVARALINEPDVLFADEPTGNLNSASSTALLDELQKINAAGQTIIMVTHELKAACRAKRVMYLQDGQILEELDLQEPAQNRGKREVLLFAWLKKQGW